MGDIIPFPSGRKDVVHSLESVSRPTELERSARESAFSQNPLQLLPPDSIFDPTAVFRHITQAMVGRELDVEVALPGTDEAIKLLLEAERVLDGMPGVTSWGGPLGAVVLRHGGRVDGAGAVRISADRARITVEGLPVSPSWFVVGVGGAAVLASKLGMGLDVCIPDVGSGEKKTLGEVCTEMGMATGATACRWDSDQADLVAEQLRDIVSLRAPGREL